MSETEKKKKGGRPKSRIGDVPLIFAKMRSRIRKEVVMQAPIAQELDQYVEWARMTQDPPLSEEDAMSFFISTAVEDVLKRDPLWSAAKAKKALQKDSDEEEDEDLSTLPSAASGRASDNGKLPPPAAPPRLNGGSTNGSAFTASPARDP